MKELFINKLMATKLKSLGFKEECLAVYGYNDDIYLQSTEINNPSYVKHAAILYQQAEKFLKNAILSDDEKENLINELNYSF